MIVMMAVSTLLLLNSSCAPVEQPFGIIFSANLDGNQDLYRSNSQDFQSAERLTFTPDDREEYLRITKNGGKILYSALEPDLTWMTYILDVDSGKTIKLNDATLDLRSIIPLAWSFDENEILLSEVQTGKIYVKNPDNESVREFKVPSSGKGQTYQVTYSPDGNEIIYSISNINGYPILSSFLYDLGKKNELQLGSADANCSFPKWSPVGNKILLYCNLSTDISIKNSHVYILEFSNNDPIEIRLIADLACGHQSAWAPGNNFAWSPDGKKIVGANCKIDDDSKPLVIFNSDGSIDRAVLPKSNSDNALYISEMAWFPNGQKILYLSGEDKKSLNIFMVDANGSNNHPITTQPSNYRELSVYDLVPQ
jgi:Tol biopolymer transport system component